MLTHLRILFPVLVVWMLRVGLRHGEYGRSGEFVADEGYGIVYIFSYASVWRSLKLFFVIHT